MIIIMRSNYSESKCVRGKRCFIIASALIVAAIVYVLFAPCLNNKCEGKSKNIDVGICGAINRPAVYNMPEGKTLANLIVKGNGLHINADVDRLDLNEVLVKRHIYHIPSRKKSLSVENVKLFSFSDDEILDDSSPVSDRDADIGDKEINILYIGYPALFFIITYEEISKKVRLTYIPHSTVFLDNNFRMIDIFFTLGLNSTVKILQQSLSKKIDYYYMQDKSSFVNMIDAMGGLDIDVDDDFAEEYLIEKGKQSLEGKQIYDYISFVKGHKNTNDLDFNKYQDLLNNKRRSRQREVVTAMYNRVGDEIENNKIEFCKSVFAAGEKKSNIDILDFTSIISKMLNMSSMSFEAIPGKYKKVGGKMYYVTATTAYKYFTKEQKSEVFNLNKGKDNQIIY